MKLRNLLAATIIALLPVCAHADGVDGNWTVRPDRGVQPWAVHISGSSATVLQPDADGTAYDTGWWTQTGQNGNSMQVTLRFDPLPVENVEIRLIGANRAEVWESDGSKRLASMERGNCPLDLTFREKSATPPSGCGWLHIQGYGFSGLEGECVFDADWVQLTPEQEKARMECLITVPAEFAN